MRAFNSYIIRHPGDTSPAICPKCLIDKPPSEYHIHSVRKDGAVRYRPYCKLCRRVRARKPRVRPVHAGISASGQQTCRFCHVTKPLSEFYANGCFSDGVKRYRSRCKTCVLEKATRDHPVVYLAKAAKRSANPKNFISTVLNHAAARKQHLGFDIDLMYLLSVYERQQGRCALSGVPMTYRAGSGRVPTNISIDRIDSRKGYCRGNVQFVCDVVNRMKQDMSEAELRRWCRYILEAENGQLQDASVAAS